MTHLRRPPLIASVLVPGLLAAGLLGACDKPNDLPHLQDEATTAAKSYQDRFDDLGRRARAIHGEALSGDTQRVYQQAISTLSRYRNDLRQIPLRIQAGARSGPPEELQKLIDEMHERDVHRHGFEGAVIEVNAELTAVESQIALADQRPHGEPAPTPAAPRPSEGNTAGSDAPVQ
ncbi:MAG TPA: hypothetical protein VH165_30095 [Kofleriaceae bacterium]|nr:hypothetical protein [Kofleriaceae bacterium]